ncbi:MAG: MnhB domain-containing protein [Caldilineaceae bacterium]
MPELYLRLLDRVLTPVLLILSAYLFLRGHNAPGGGFIAGLVASVAFELQILSRGERFVRKRIGPYLHPMTGVGLLCAATAALIGLRDGEFFESIWTAVHLGAAEIELGNPMLFDFGVLLVVVSVVVSILLGLSSGYGGAEQ